MAKQKPSKVKTYTSELAQSEDGKKIRVLIEIPERWYDLDESPIGWLSTSLRDEVRSILKQAIVQEYLDNFELPDIDIDRKELRQAITAQLANRLIEDKLGGENQ